MSFKYLYRVNQQPDDAYILISGEVIFYITNQDKFKLSGKNILIGTPEIILSEYLNISTPRLETAVFNSTSQLKHLPKEKFISQFNQYSYLINVARVLAKKLTLTNSILNHNQQQLVSDFVTIKKICLEYYSIIKILQDEYDKRKLPWLKKFISPYANSLTYLKGESFSKAETPVRIIPSDALKDKTIDLPKGETLFSAGDDGNEMYILNSGTINVMVNNNKVAALSETGTPIGEVALLLGQSRSATLVTSSEVRLTKITRDDLSFIAQNDINNIVYSLAKKYYNNINKIKETNDALLNSSLDHESGDNQRIMEREHALTDLNELKTKTGDIIYEKKADFLKERLNNLI